MNARQASLLLVLCASCAFALSCGTDGDAGGSGTDTDTGSGIACDSDDVCAPGTCVNGRCAAPEDVGGDIGGSDIGGTPDVGDDTGAGPDAEDAGGDDAADSGPSPGSFGAPCEEQSDCDSGLCIDVGDGNVCTSRCTDSCPDPTWECVVLNSGGDPIQLCVPPQNVLCVPCDRDLDCGGLDDRCIDLLDGSFCGTSCGDLGCAEGYLCDEVTSVGGTLSPQCVPEAGVCAGCLDPDGDEYGLGESCFGGDCDELDPTVFDGAPEICDGRDNDCDEEVDEGFDLQNDDRHCGRCGNACTSDTGSGECFMGACRITSCSPGRYDLNGEWSDGCEYECVPSSTRVEVCNGEDDDCDGDIDEGFDLLTDANNCGSCGNVCRLPGASEICSAGDCVISACEPPLLHCNASQDDGCEVDPRSDVDNCGRCGNRCDVNNATAACVASTCTIGTCDDYFGDCDGLADERGCETDLRTTAAHCGACDNPCVDPPGAIAGCRPPTDCTGAGCPYGECYIASCADPDYLNCNGSTPAGFADGCESYRFDVTSCLSCGNRCGYRNATAGCNEGGCFLDECLPGFHDINSRDSDGCEYACTPSNGGVETCDGVDNDCNGSIDDAVAGAPVWYRDGDGDTWGDTGSQVRACEAPPGYISRGGDCDDIRPDVNPGAVEICDGIDNNCVEGRDEGLAIDFDRDGHYALGSCASPADDCDDRDPNNFPGNVERCDGQENNCDANTDTEGSLGCVTYYYDSDNDSWGTTAGPCLCAPNGNYRATRGGDCFDGSNQVFPGQPLYFTSPRIDGSWDYNCDSTGDPQYPSAAQTCQVTPTTCATSASAGWRDGVPACGAAAPWVETCFFDDTGNPDTSGCRWNTTESRVQPCR